MRSGGAWARSGGPLVFMMGLVCVVGVCVAGEAGLWFLRIVG
jgi:hypothetical protein